MGARLECREHRVKFTIVCCFALRYSSVPIHTCFTYTSAGPRWHVGERGHRFELQRQRHPQQLIICP